MPSSLKCGGFPHVYAVVAGVLLSPCGCANGFTLCGGRCLKILDKSSSYTTAKEACAAFGAILAVPRSEKENQCALCVADAGKKAFLGINDIASEGVFVGDDGASDPLPVSDTWWLEGQPDNGGQPGYNQDCVALYGRGWVDTTCGHSSGWPSFPLCQIGF